MTRIAGSIVRTYSAIKQRHPELPFGGYYALGVCNDVNAMIELKMSRIIQSRTKRDSWVDLAGYAGCGYECTIEENA